MSNELEEATEPCPKCGKPEDVLVIDHAGECEKCIDWNEQIANEKIEQSDGDQWYDTEESEVLGEGSSC